MRPAGRTAILFPNTINIRRVKDIQFSIYFSNFTKNSLDHAIVLCYDG